MDLIKPPRLRPGDTVGVFSPSTPAHMLFREKYLHGVDVLRRMGFKVVEGSCVASQRSQGYRTGTPKERAAEFMELIRDDRVKCLISSIGGANSSSLIPYIDFEEVRAKPKIICGYSDVTSLHLSLMAYSGLSTFYGPAVMPSFGEWPDVLPETLASFFLATQETQGWPRRFEPPSRWSNHFRNAKTGEWKSTPRSFQNNRGWRALNSGQVKAPLIVANLNTLMTSAGTSYFPKLEGKVLLIEEMDAALAEEERDFRHLERLGVFEIISGLIVGKPEKQDLEGAPFDYDDLILEVVGSNRRYPIVTQFDCSHTQPMMTLAQGISISLEAGKEYEVGFVVNEPMVSSY